MSRTALDLTPQEWQAYQPGRAVGTAGKKYRELAGHKHRARQVAQQAAQLLRDKFQAGRVVLFGSLARQDEFTRWSDIDLAAWGIPATRFYAAVAAITGLSPEFKLDLVDPDACHPSLQAAIERDGVEL